MGMIINAPLTHKHCPSEHYCLCLRLVNWREELRDMQHILLFLQDFFPPVFFFFLPRQKILFTGCHFKEGFEECAAEHWAIYVGFCSWKVYLDVIWYSLHSLCESRPFTVAMPGVGRKRELECYRSPDKDCSHCQVSRPGQLNTGGDPSTYAHPWDRDLEKRDGNRRGCQRVRFKVSSLWRQLICWKRYKVNNLKFSRTLYFLLLQMSRLVYYEQLCMNGE